jgi:hypothetical protein
VKAATRIPTEDQRKAEMFKRTIRYIADRHGSAAMVEAFGDPEPINAAWELEDLEGFRRCEGGRSIIPRDGPATVSGPSPPGSGHS